MVWNWGNIGMGKKGYYKKGWEQEGRSVHFLLECYRVRRKIRGHWGKSGGSMEENRPLIRKMEGVDLGGSFVKTGMVETN